MTSYFPRTIREWDLLPPTLIEVNSCICFQTNSQNICNCVNCNLFKFVIVGSINNCCLPFLIIIIIWLYSDNTIPTNDNISFPSSSSRFQFLNQQLVSSLFSFGHVCRHEYILIWICLAENKRPWKYFGFNFIASCSSESKEACASYLFSSQYELIWWFRHSSQK